MITQSFVFTFVISSSYFYCLYSTLYLSSFPTRRSSDLLASWAFLFLIAPLVAAFGLTRAVPWHFYVVTPVLIALFIGRSEEHTSELHHTVNSYAVFCLKKKRLGYV